jgi:hypothetical protein
MNKHKNISLGCGKLKIFGLSLLISVSSLVSVLAESKQASCKDNCNNASTNQINILTKNRDNAHRKIISILEAAYEDFLADATQNSGKCLSDRDAEVKKCKNSKTAADSQNDGFYQQSVANATFQLNNAVIPRNQYQTTTNALANKWFYQKLDNDTQLEKCKNDKEADHTRCEELVELSYNSNGSKALNSARKSWYDANEIYRISELEASEKLESCLSGCGS